jgi:sugar lactone lactonase YvrE
VATTLLSDLRAVEAVLRRPHGLLEAPRFSGHGGVVYSDVSAGGVWECSSSGEIREILPRRRGVGGIVAHSDDGWVISGRNVVHLLANGEQREVLAGEGVCGYNDLGAAPDGALLAGVLRFRPFAGDDPRPGQLLKIDGDGAVEILTEDVIWPNGIGLSPDGEEIYLSDYARGVVLAVPAQGGDTREFCASPRGSADGLAVDVDGAVWVALGEGGGIARLLADGELDGVIDLPANFVSSLSFGGADMREVLITTADNHAHPELGGTLFRARSEVAGLPLTPVDV